MPTIGEKQRGNKLGYKSNAIHIWAICAKCGKGRWVTIYNINRKLCHDCVIHSKEFSKLQSDSHQGFHHTPETKQKMHELWLAKPHFWKGGVIPDGHGYIQVILRATDPYFTMANKRGYVKQHRLVMAKYLGRCLEADELVHHKNGVRTDNRICNLAIVKHHSHANRTYISTLQQRIRELENQLATQRLFN